MSGPPYPHPNPIPGSNAIGDFEIGVSPIGTINPFDPWSTILSQYANSLILTTLITNFAQYVDQTVNMDNFYDDVFNIDTAQGHGLDVLGRIIGVVRTVTLPGDVNYFGFQEAGSWFGFNEGVFYTGLQSTPNFILSDTAFRLLLFAKAISNISDGSIPSINQLLLNLFPSRGNCYCTDGGDMTMTYTFVFSLSVVERAVLEQSGALPKPVGVSATLVSP